MTKKKRKREKKNSGCYACPQKYLCTTTKIDFLFIIFYSNYKIYSLIHSVGLLFYNWKLKSGIVV